MGSRKNVVLKHNTGGLESYIFTLYIRHGGRIEQSIPPKYLGGKVKIFNGIDSDEWGFICLKEKFAELGYKEGNFRFFSVVEDCLMELLSDSETLNVANSVIRPQLVEVWVVQSSSAEYEEDEIIEEGYIGESEDELVSVDEESSANEYEEDNVDNLEVELGDVNDEVNLSDERPIPGSDGEVESNKRNMEPEIEAQREGQAGMVADIAENGTDQAGRVDDNDGNAQIEADIAENAHTEMQEEMLLLLMFDYNSWFMTKLPPLCLCRRSSRTSFIGHEHGFFKCDCQVRGYKHKDNSSTEQRDAADEVQRKKKKVLGLPKKMTIMKRKYYTRSNQKSKFSNTQNDPITLE
nr:uncharacterized protein LOC109184816 [Ipomoea trifida]